MLAAVAFMVPKQCPTKFPREHPVPHLTKMAVLQSFLLKCLHSPYTHSASLCYADESTLWGFIEKTEVVKVVFTFSSSVYHLSVAIAFLLQKAIFTILSKLQASYI